MNSTTERKQQVIVVQSTRSPGTTHAMQTALSHQTRIENFENVRDSVLKYRNDRIVRRLARELNTSISDATAIFEDTLRFLILCGALKGPFAPSPRIDEGWHAFVLHTKDYQSFCLEYFGCFIHHAPRAEGTPAPEGIVSRTKGAARFCFGDLSENWKYNGDGVCAQSPECDSCSQCDGGD